MIKLFGVNFFNYLFKMNNLICSYDSLKNHPSIDMILLKIIKKCQFEFCTFLNFMSHTMQRLSFYKFFCLTTFKSCTEKSHGCNVKFQ
jgi:hypothetical protein